MQMTVDGSRIWLPIVVECIAHSLPANEVACTLRLVDKWTSLLLGGFNTVRLSLPSPLESFKQRWGRPDAFRGLTRKQRLKLLCLTAASGSIANLEVALDNAGLLGYGDLLEAAVEAGQLQACKFLRERGWPWGDSLAAAARGGHRHLCEWLLASGCRCCLDDVCAAAHGGHEGLMHWLLQLFRESHAAGDVSVWRLLQAAAAGFSLAPLQRLHQQLLAGQQQQQGGDEVQPPRGPGVHEQASILAAAAGSSTPDWPAKVQWLEGLGYPRTTVSGVMAAGRSVGDDTVSRLQWLHSRGYPLDGWAANRAAGQGNLAALRFLVEQAGVRPTSDAPLCAAMEGHLDVVQYLYASGAPMDAALVAHDAALYGHMPVVAWAVEAMGANPDNAPDLLSSAATCGNVGLMTWLLERGWTWDEEATVAAAESGCVEALEWLVVHGCPWEADGHPYFGAATYSDLAMVRCLHPLGCPWGPNQLTDCIQGWAVPVPMLRCLVELGCPVDCEAAAVAAEAHRPGDYHAAVLDWLAEERRRQQQQQRVHGV